MNNICNNELLCLILLDNNECELHNGNCDHSCHNVPGSYHCKCNKGYTLLEDGLSCDPLPCPTLSEPADGFIDCTGPQVTDESCLFTCNAGYSLSGSSIRQCLSNSTWSGVDSVCILLHCIELESNTSSLVVLPCYTEFNSTCTLICEDGYYLKNETAYKQTCSLKSNGGVAWTEPETCLSEFFFISYYCIISF